MFFYLDEYKLLARPRVAGHYISKQLEGDQQLSAARPILIQLSSCF